MNEQILIDSLLWDAYSWSINVLLLISSRGEFVNI